LTIYKCPLIPAMCRQLPEEEICIKILRGLCVEVSLFICEWSPLSADYSHLKPVLLFLSVDVKRFDSKIQNQNNTSLHKEKKLKWFKCSFSIVLIKLLEIWRNYVKCLLIFYCIICRKVLAITVFEEWQQSNALITTTKSPCCCFIKCQEISWF
jgi:hypothetical protein